MLGKHGRGDDHVIWLLAPSFASSISDTKTVSAADVVLTDHD